jgi:nitrate/nitrite-specific signal transduction histidine kinase
MTIRLKLHLIIFLLVVAAGVIIGVMTYAWSSIDQESSEAALANQTVRSVFELNMLTYDLLTGPGARPGAQWRAAHRRLGETLDRIEMTSLTDEEVPLVKKLRENYRLLADLFDDLAEAQRRRAGSEASPAERIIGQSLLLRSSLMSDAAFRFANLGSEDLFQRKRSAFEWVGVAVSMLAVVIGFILFVNRRIIHSVTLLQRGADAIGQHDFQHKIALQGNDELAHLARAIGDMSAQIEKSYSQLRENEKRTRLGDRQYAGTHHLY